MMSEPYLPSSEQLAELYPDGRSDGSKITNDNATAIEKLAYRWAVMNDIVTKAAAKNPNVRVFVYDQICADPIAEFREMLSWAGLNWDQSCDAFIRSSLRMDSDADGYHTLLRNPMEAATRWRTTLSEDEQYTIAEIASQSSAADYFGSDLLAYEPGQPS
ncbi:MAG: hypothetical protein V2I76_13380 [Roseobacter sp.]|nr:hypothetical protein [Roseobacter sp.]